MRFDIKLLGTLEATFNDVSFMPSASKQRQLLAILTLNAGRAVPVSVLMEEMWGSLPPRTSSTTLHTYVGKIRGAVEAALRGDPEHSAKDILVTERIGYRLNVPREAIDISQYERLAGVGRLAAEAGDYVSAARDLEAALALWRGSALSDISPGPHLMCEVVRLEESRLSDLDLRIEMDLRLGRHRRLLGELAGLCARYPMSENLCAQYMVALYRSGQQWRALEVFHRLRATIVDQLGVDPSVRIRQLHQAILCGDPAVDRPSFVTSGWATNDAFAS
jgi:DNA-binding SARP family transcriptional activator